MLRWDISHIHNGTTHRPRGLKLGIFRCLKAGVNPEYEQEPPEWVSPYCNIALNDIEEIHQSVRYADDMVIILKPKMTLKQYLTISQFLAERGDESK